MTFDPTCCDLAGHFLRDFTFANDADYEAAARELAEKFQQVTEDHLASSNYTPRVR